MRIHELVDSSLLEGMSVHKSPQWSKQTFTIYEDPTPQEFMNLLNAANGIVRALIGEDGELLVWDADKALHSDVDTIMGASDLAGFVIYDTHIDAQLCDIRWLRGALKKNAAMKSLKVDRLRMTKNR